MLESMDATHEELAFSEMLRSKIAREEGRSVNRLAVDGSYLEAIRSSSKEEDNIMVTTSVENKGLEKKK